MHWFKQYRSIAMSTLLSAVMLHMPLHAQVAPSAFRNPHPLWVGAEYSNINASFPYQSNQRLAGVGIFADYKLSWPVGVEADARFLHWGGYEGSTESSYLIGPKAYFLSKGRFRPYAKVLFGVGKIHYPFQIGDANYFALAPGAGTGYRLSSRWMLRAEYEYQMWPNSPGYPNEPKHPLSPNGFHVGVAYRVFR
jgi:opacity protein-like surface antigen